MEQLSVRELEARDIPLLDAYWRSLTRSDLERMFIDRDKLPTSGDFRGRLGRLLETPLEDRASDPLIWEVDGKTVGFTNLSNIVRGEQASVHLHMFAIERRAKGLGRRLFALSVDKYFQRHRLEKVVCEPAATNPGPNGLMLALNIFPLRTYRTTPAPICVEHVVNHYVLDPALVASVMDSLNLSKSPECLICSKHQATPSSIILQGEHAVLTHYPCTAETPKMYKGYLFVEAKRHVPSFAELNDQEAAEIGIIVAKASKLLKQNLGAEHVYTFTIGDLVPHLHVHLIPRYPGAPKEFWGGRKLTEWPDAPVIGPKEIAELSEKLKSK